MTGITTTNNIVAAAAAVALRLRFGLVLEPDGLSAPVVSDGSDWWFARRSLRLAISDGETPNHGSDLR